MASTELTNTGWEKDSVVLGNWTNRADVVEDAIDGIVVAAGVVANTRNGRDSIQGTRI